VNDASFGLAEALADVVMLQKMKCAGLTHSKKTEEHLGSRKASVEMLCSHGRDKKVKVRKACGRHRQVRCLDRGADNCKCFRIV